MYAPFPFPARPDVKSAGVKPEGPAISSPRPSGNPIRIGGPL